MSLTTTKYQCTECDTIWQTFESAAECHKGIGGVIEVQAPRQPVPQRGPSSAAREADLRERHDNAWSVTLQRPSETPHIIVTGNPVDGFGFIGPFDNASDAVDWADIISLEPDWWVAEVRVPADVPR